jgi:hypothetical protein
MTATSQRRVAAGRLGAMILTDQTEEGLEHRLRGLWRQPTGDGLQDDAFQLSLLPRTIFGRNSILRFELADLGSDRKPRGEQRDQLGVQRVELSSMAVKRFAESERRVNLVHDDRRVKPGSAARLAFGQGGCQARLGQNRDFARRWRGA